jgi:glycerol uptake facilitator-like aquaporin
VSSTTSQRLVAEFIATAGLLAAVVGSGIMGESLAGGNGAIALLANTLATAAALVALILTFGPISGAHMNPVVTMVEALEKRLPGRDALAYLAVQTLGGVAGVWLAHVMFDKPILMTSEHVRSGVPQLVSEAVATFGLLCTILGTARHRPTAVPFAVGAYIAAAYWFTASTSFANPAVTVARTLTNTFAGIRPVDAPGFIAAQVVGAVLALAVFRWLSRVSVRTGAGSEP